MFKIRNILKNTVIHLRRGVKIALLLFIGVAIITFLIFVVYKPMYSVTLNGEFLGYTSDKGELQNKINEYMKSGDNQTVAFVEIDDLPEYKMCLLKKGLVANDDEILSTIISAGTPYYKYYAILDDGIEKCYVPTYEQSEEIINGLKEKNSNNKDSVTCVVKYDTQLLDFTEPEAAIASLYVKPKVNTKTMKKTVTGSNTVVYTNSSLGLASIQQPVSGMITSRFGARSSIRSSAHTGLDIATSLGTPFVPITSGTVTFAAYKGSYGNLIIVNHGINSSGQKIETYYAHCYKLNVNVGDYVTKNSIIGYVGSTGNSTGPHLHLEIRINGKAVNPQNYLYN